MAAAMVTVDLLDGLKERWRAQGAPIADELRSGLSEDAIQELVGRLGLRAPVEALVWWGWHNGAGTEVMSGGYGFAFISLEAAVEHALWHRQMALDVGGDLARSIWSWDWLPVSLDAVGGQLVIEANTEPVTGPSRVLYHDRDDRVVDSRMSAPSMGALVQAWSDLLDAGAQVYDHDEGRWERVDENIPPRYANVML